MVTAAVLVVLATLIVYSARRFETDNQWVAHGYTVLAKLESVQSARYLTITSHRNYLLSNDATYATQFSDGKVEITVQLNELRYLIRDNQAQSQRLQRMSGLLDRRLQNATQVLQIRDREGLAAAQELMTRNGSPALDNKIDALVLELRECEKRLLAARSAASQFQFDILQLIALLAVPLCLLVVGINFWLLNKEIKQRRHSELAGTAANIELKGTIEQVRRLSADMSALNRYSGMLQSCNDLPELLDISTQALAGLAPELAGTLYLVRTSRDYAEVAANWGRHRADSNALPSPGDCWAMRRSQPFFCDRLHGEVKCAHIEMPPPSRPTATACLPLSAQGELLGWIYLSGPAPGPLPGIEIVLQAAEQLSLALANLRLRETLRRQSIRDPLTGLFNRRYLEESLAREVARCQRRQMPMVVLMLDIDHFKAFNDLHGHPGGDTLLAAFGRLLQSSCRLEDIPCRYGGEEFTLILPEADASVGLDRARSLLLATSQLAVAHNGLTLPRVTVSIGLAVLPRDGNNASSLIEAADLALYRAKSQGRNQVQQAAYPAQG